MQESAGTIPPESLSDNLAPVEKKNVLPETKFVPELTQAVSAETGTVLADRDNFGTKTILPELETAAEREHPEQIQFKTHVQVLDSGEEERQKAGDKTFIPTMNEHDKKAPLWKLWKEKIQGFIKKLFD